MLSVWKAWLLAAKTSIIPPAMLLARPSDLDRMITTKHSRIRDLRHRCFYRLVSVSGRGFMWLAVHKLDNSRFFPHFYWSKLISWWFKQVYCEYWNYDYNLLCPSSLNLAYPDLWISWDPTFWLALWRVSCLILFYVQDIANLWTFIRQL